MQDYRITKLEQSSEPEPYLEKCECCCKYFEAYMLRDGICGACEEI